MNSFPNLLFSTSVINLSWRYTIMHIKFDFDTFFSVFINHKSILTYLYTSTVLSIFKNYYSDKFHFNWFWFPFLIHFILFKGINFQIHFRDIIIIILSSLVFVKFFYLTIAMLTHFKLNFYLHWKLEMKKEWIMVNF